MAKIPLSCADFTFPLVRHEMALDLVSNLGFEGVDVALIHSYPHLPIETVIDDTHNWGRSLREKLAARGLALADVIFTPGPDFSTRSINHPDPEKRRESLEWFHRALEFVVSAGGKHMTMLPGTTWSGETISDSLRRAADGLSERLEEGRKAGVIVSVEPHLGSLIPTPQDTRDLIEMTPGLTLTLDYTHFVRQEISQDECESLLAFASHFHARGAKGGRLQTSLKENIIDYPRVLNRLKELNYAGYFALEYVWDEWESCNDIDTLSETILLRDLAEQHR